MVSFGLVPRQEFYCMSRCMLIHLANAVAKRPMLLLRVDQLRVCSAELQRRGEATTRSFSRASRSQVVDVHRRRQQAAQNSTAQCP